MITNGPGVKFSQFVNGGAAKAGDRAAGLRNGNNTLFDISAFNGAVLSRQITQAAHGFTVGEIITFNPGTLLYVLAQADNAADAEVIGIVTAIIDVNNFILQFGGYVSGLTIPLVAGTVYFLSPTIAGAMTSTAPTTPGQVRKSLLFSDSTSSGYWQNYQGQQL